MLWIRLIVLKVLSTIDLSLRKIDVICKLTYLELFVKDSNSLYNTGIIDKQC